MCKVLRYSMIRASDPQNLLAPYIAEKLIFFTIFVKSTFVDLCGLTMQIYYC